MRLPDDTAGEGSLQKGKLVINQSKLCSLHAECAVTLGHRLRSDPAKLVCGNALRVSADAHCSSLDRAEVQVLAKDTGHHGDKSKHDGDDHHNLQHNTILVRLAKLQCNNDMKQDNQASHTTQAALTDPLCINEHHALHCKWEPATDASLYCHCSLLILSLVAHIAGVLFSFLKFTSAPY